MIHGIASVQTFLNPSVMSASRVGRRSVPVRPMQSVYASFKHVVGVPSRSPGSQVPLGKLRVLDNLIDRLINVRGQKGEAIRVTNENVDPLIDQFKGELHTAVRASTPLFTGLYPETGTVLNMLA